jgi:hypothetical protein
MPEMSKHHRWKRRPADGTGVGADVPQFEDLPPVHIDRERLNLALRGERSLLPDSVRTAEDFISFMDHVAKDVR